MGGRRHTRVEEHGGRRRTGTEQNSPRRWLDCWIWRRGTTCGLSSSLDGYYPHPPHDPTGKKTLPIPDPNVWVWIRERVLDTHRHPDGGRCKRRISSRNRGIVISLPITSYPSFLGFLHSSTLLCCRVQNPGHLFSSPLFYF